MEKTPRTPARPIRFSIFALLTIGTGLLLWILCLDLRPKPFLHRLTGKDLSLIPCTADKPLTFTLVPPQTPRTGMWVRAKVSQKHPIRVLVRDPDSGNELGRFTLSSPGWSFLKLPEISSLRLQVRFESDVFKAKKAPALYTTRAASLGRDLSPAPLLIFEFPWPTRHLLWLWALLPLAGWWAWKQESYAAVYLLTLALCCLATSVLYWQTDYSLSYGHYDADAYGHAARKMVQYFTAPEKRPKIAEFFRNYPHSPTMLGPALMTPAIAAGLSFTTAYLVFSSACGIAALLLFADLLMRHLQVGSRVMLAGTTLFATHWLHLRSFSRPITDQFGLLLVVALLWLLLDRMRKRTLWQTVAFSALFFALPLARPQGISYLPFLGLGVLTCDTLREGRVRWKELMATAVSLGAIPAILLACLYVGFDWFHNFRLMVEKAATFTAVTPKWMVFPCLLTAFQCFPLIWICGGRELWKNSGVRLLGIWILFYLAVMFAVDAPMMPRHFLPLLPAIIGLSTTALHQPRWAKAAWCLALLACVANVTALIFQVTRTLPPEKPLRYFITSP